MELTIYLVLCSVVVLYTVSYNKIVGLFGLSLLLAYLVVTRVAEPSVDMKVYYTLIQQFRPYMLKEFLYYGVTHLLYGIIGFEDLAFILLDLIFLTALMLSLRSILGYKKSLFIVFLIYLSFIGVMGGQNVYRQFLGSILVLISYVYFLSGMKARSYSIFVLSVFFHNAMVFVLPFFFYLEFRCRLVQKILFDILFLIFVGFFLTWFFSSGIYFKSNRDTGADYMMLYWCFSISVFLLAYLSKIVRKPIFMNSFFYISSLLPFFLLSGGSTAGERIFMSFFPILIFDLVRYISIFRFNQTMLRLTLFLSFVLPTFLFFSARQFII